MAELTAQEVVLNKIFSSDYEFHIPDYQRPYAWEVEQAQELLEDLTEAALRSPKEPYFLGSLVLVKDKGVPQADVIDGQQRLTTLTILLAILRDLSQDDELRMQLDLMVQQPKQIIMKLEARPRLTLRPKDADFFGTFVQRQHATERLLSLKPDEMDTDSQRAFQANARAMHAVLNGWSDGERLELVRMLAASTYLVAVSTPDLESAHRVFGVMNSRGLDLSPADIFKSRVIGALDDSSSATYAAKWEEAEELIGRSEFADLFLHIRLIESKQRARQGLLKEFPEQVLNSYLPLKAREFVDDLVVPYAKAYEQIRDRTYASTAGADCVNAWFSRLQQLDNNDWRSPALWAMRNHAGDPQWLDGFLQKLERLAASMFIRREWTTPRLVRYIELLRQLDEGQGLDAPAFELTPSEQEETIAVLDGDLYLNRKIRKYVLLRLDETLANSGATYAQPIITVEHVLPQNPNEGSSWTIDFTDEQRVQWTHRIANLVLLNQAKNSEAQNFEFDIKKAKYFTGKRGVATFALTSQVLNHESWTPEVLQVRQLELVHALSNVWTLNR